MKELRKTKGIERFKAYSHYYDAIYVDKDYDFETNWLYAQIVKHSPTNQPLKHLDLGAGTGKHAVRLAQKGVRVTGVELSSEMVSLSPKHGNLSMLQGDLSTFQSKEKFDSCSAMFHVLSYMAEIDEMKGALKNAAAHLEPGGIFIFDVWHSPAVQNLGVEFRVKRVSLPGLEIVRLAEPSEDTQSKTVTVKYTLFVAKDGAEEYSQITETHVLRHYDQQEVQSAISDAGMSLLGCFESFTGRALNQDTWSACYVAAKN